MNITALSQRWLRQSRMSTIALGEVLSVSANSTGADSSSEVQELPAIHQLNLISSKAYAGGRLMVDSCMELKTCG